jgi:hypothetical protein
MTGSRARCLALLLATTVAAAGCGGGGGGGGSDTTSGSAAGGAGATTGVATTSDTKQAQDWCTTAAAYKLSTAANDAQLATVDKNLQALRTAAQQARIALAKVPPGTGCAAQFLNQIVKSARSVPGSDSTIRAMKKARADHRLPLHPY